MMKKFHNILIVAVIAAAFTVTSCVDELKFGNSFLDKPPGGTVTADTVFTNAEYTKQFLTSIYALQYYGLPYAGSSTSFPYQYSFWIGKWEVLSDLWQANTTEQQAIEKFYYTGTLTSGYGLREHIYDYTRSNIWENIRWCWLMLENIEDVPGLSASEKTHMIAETKCLLAATYWNAFRHYGGLPLIYGTFSGSDSSYDLPRNSAEETVRYIVDLFDEAIPDLEWSVATPANDIGRWTKAAAMGVKTSVLLFAASPLFNDNEPYHPDGANLPAVWYGGYKDSYWDECLAACEDFFRELNANGYYYLVEATGNRPQDYRAAFRRAYWNVDSPEVLHSTRVWGANASTFNDTYYLWHNWQWNYNRGQYNPTQDFMEMFPWADGRPYDWNTEVANGTLDRMFYEPTTDPTSNLVLTRDPRMYETAQVNGVPKSLDKNTGNMSGWPYETWVGGVDAGQNPETEYARYATGYGLMKWYLGADAGGESVHWSYIRLAEVYLNYAEALCNRGRLQEAINQVDILRKRVGLDGLAQCNPTKNLTSDKDALLAEILRERCCELAMEDHRYFDLIRYKMKDRFEARPNRLKITRTDKPGEQWFGSSDPWPTFSYEKLPINSPNRVWWNGFDTKWYLSPFPLDEINKDYGLIQNPGW